MGAERHDPSERRRASTLTARAAGMLGLVRRLLIALLWGWLVIGSLVFLTGKCSNDREGALGAGPAVPAYAP